MAKYCKHCGEELDEGGVFCPGCGATVEAPAAQPPADQYAPPQGQYAPPPPEQYAQPQGRYAPPPQGQYAPPPDQYAQPQGQYVPPMQGQYAAQPEYIIPQLKLTKQHLLIIIIAVVAIVAVLLIVNLTKDNDRGSRGDDNDTVMDVDVGDEETDEDDTGGDDTDVDAPGGDEGNGPVAPPTNPQPGGGNTGGDSGGKSVFNVSSFDDLPFGTTTVNQIASKNGTPEKTYLYHTKETNTAFVVITYPNASIAFAEIEASKFSSIGGLVGDQGITDLSKKDWDLQMKVLSVIITGQGGKMPNGLEIGKSTKSDIVAAFGNNPSTEYAGDDGGFLAYDYTFSGEPGQLMLYYDKKEVLESVMLIPYG